MQAPSEFGFGHLITVLLRGLADAIADRPGNTEAQRLARHQTAIFSVLGVHATDTMETIVAGQMCHVRSPDAGRRARSAAQ